MADEHRFADRGFESLKDSKRAGNELMYEWTPINHAWFNMFQPRPLRTTIIKQVISVLKFRQNLLVKAMLKER